MLAQSIQERGASLDRLARQSGVRKQTIHNWLSGKSAKPYYWDKLLQVAAALGVTRVRASRLLLAAGQPPIGALAATLADPQRRALLAPWLATVPNNLPSPLTSFVGREAEVVTIGELLCAPSARLVTLTGPGGSGKTRLALAVAGELFGAFPDGVFFVDLAPLAEPARVLPTIAAALAVRDRAGVTAEQRLIERLADRRVLLVLDNFEQVIDAGPAIVALLRGASHLKALVTSRLALRVSGEHDRAVLPLVAPSAEVSLAEVKQNPAATLFVERARAVNPDFVLARANAPAIAEVCRRLDGLPLAIELAAARVRQFTPVELLARFPSRLALGEDGPRDVPDRQRTLRATIDWSYALLTADEQRLIADLATFAGGFTPDAAVTVCGNVDDRGAAVIPGLEALRRANLLTSAVGPDGAVRLGMLETIREYALERLEEGGEGEAIRWRHAAYYRDLAETGSRYVPGAPERAWMVRVEPEQDNLRAALGWEIESGEIETAGRIAAAAWPFWHERERFVEGARWLRTALDRGDRLPDRLRARLLAGAFILTHSLGEVEGARRLGEDCLALCERERDDHGAALALLFQGLAAYNQVDFTGALDRLGRSLARWRALGEPRGVIRCLNELAYACCLYGQFDQAAGYFAEAMALCGAHGDELGLARSLTDQGLAALLQGDIARALGLLHRALGLSRALNLSSNLSQALFYLGLAETFAGDLAAAHGHLVESLRLRREAGDAFAVAYALIGLAGVAGRRGDPARAARLCGAASALQEASGVSLPPAARLLYEREVSALRARLGDAAFEAAWRDGERLSLAQAVAEASAGG
jgi:predicted ATPase/transcriptional regulator with XRE-family HTH domain